MSTMVCRLCLNEKNLINIFDSQLTEYDLLSMCILLGTGVKIRRDDIISKYICSLCCNIVICMYNYRQNAIANDKALKEYANSETFHSILNVEQKINSDFEYIPKKRRKQPRTKFAVHPTVINLFKKYPRLKIPKNLLRYNIQPKIYLDRNEVDSWKPAPKFNITPVSESINKFELHQKKLPHINIAKRSSNRGNKENSVKLAKDLRKRKGSDASSINSVTESQNKKKKFTVSSEEDRISTPVNDKIISQSKPKTSESKTKIVNNLSKFTTKLTNSHKSEVKTINSYKPKVNNSSLESDIKISDLTVKLLDFNNVKDINHQKVTDKESQRTNIASLPKLKINLRKSTREPTTKEIPSALTAFSVISNNESLSITQVDSSKNTPSVSKVDNQAVETDNGKITTKKLNNNTLYDSDNDLSDVDSIGANDMPLDEFLLDTVEEELAFPCSLCNKIFMSSFQLKCHEKTHETCLVCKLVCRSKKTLRHHYNEICFKIVNANLPDVQLTRVDKQPEIMKQYWKIFTPDTNTNDDTSEVRRISDDDDNDEVILVGESRDNIDLIKNQELKYIHEVFSNYKPKHKKTRYAETKFELTLYFNSKSQMVLEDLYTELRYYRVPVKLMADSKQSANISFSKNPTHKKEIFNWGDMPITKLSQNAVLSSLLAKENPNPETISPVTNDFVNAQLTTQISTTSS